MWTESLLRQLVRIPGAKAAWSRIPLGSLATRIHFGVWSRPHYAYCVYAAAQQAKSLNLPRISIVEMGVAGGNGLVALESTANAVSRYTGVEIAVYGFDSGIGMPRPLDYRDLPHVWGEGFYTMNESALRRRLSTARLALGDVSTTVPEFVARRDLAPIGFIAFDLDYYSSTKAAFRIFDAHQRTRLPRVYCYMDDVIWPEYACHNEYVGELRAIREFNEEHQHQKIAQLHLLRHIRPRPEAWNDQIYVMHDFAHPLYSACLTPRTPSAMQKPLSSGRSSELPRQVSTVRPEPIGRADR